MAPIRTYLSGECLPGIMLYPCSDIQITCSKSNQFKIAHIKGPWSPRELSMQGFHSNLFSAPVAGMIISLLVLSGCHNFDSDKDGVVDKLDNCPPYANALQLDTDQDGIGNRCDADMNNNQHFDAEDKSLFQQLLEQRNPLADLHEDGVVDKQDLAIFEELIRKPIITQGIAVETSFVGAPPPSIDVQLFKLPADNPSRYDTAIAVDYRGVTGLPEIIPLNATGVTLALNDLGIPPDEAAGDQVYAAYLNYDHDAQVQAVQSYLSRSEQIGNDSVYHFTGRSVASIEPFNPSALLGKQSIQQGNFEPQKVDTPLLTMDHSSPIPPGLNDILVLKQAHLTDRSLMIVDPAVIADPSRTFDRCDTDGDGVQGDVDGVWSFKSLMSEMANTPVTGISAQEFIHNWLVHFAVDSTVNSFTAEATDTPRVFSMFPGWDGVNLATLDIDDLPLRLIAIVNRIDLAKTSLYGATSSSGEIRFVFGLTLASCDGLLPGQVGVPSTIILEYGDVVKHCQSLRGRAQDWIALSSLIPGSAAYQTALQVITDEVTAANAAPEKTNGSALNQLRTNDFGFIDSSEGDWIMREFVVGDDHDLMMTTVKQTPQFQPFRIDSATTGNFVSNNAPAVSCQSHEVLLEYDGEPFLGATADTFGNYEFNDAFNPVAAWRIPISVPANIKLCADATVSGTPTDEGTLRHKFALNTCDGCHITETPTRQHHINPTDPPPAALSGFLTGSDEEDIRAPGVVRHFNDLQRRGQFMEDIAAKSCFSAAFLPRLHDPLVIFPLVPPVFKLGQLQPDIDQAHFSRRQQLMRMVH